MVAVQTGGVEEAVELRRKAAPGPQAKGGADEDQANPAKRAFHFFP